MSDVSTEVVRRVYDDKEGVFIEIGPDADTSELVEIRTTTEPSRNWFGDFRISLSSEIARAVGHALIAAAQERDDA